MKLKSWNEMYSLWEFLFQECWIPKNNIFNFCSIDVDLLPGLNYNQSYDWWPKEELEQRRLVLLRETLASQPWETKKGTLHTIQELHAAKGNLELQTAIWIMASLFDKKHSSPYDWSDESKQIFYDLFNLIKDEFPEVNQWSNATREALPFSIIGSGYMRNILFSDVQQLMYLIVAEAALVNGNWQLVEFNKA